jgi:hypothetical protein
MRHNERLEMTTIPGCPGRAQKNRELPCHEIKAAQMPPLQIGGFARARG